MAFDSVFPRRSFIGGIPFLRGLASLLNIDVPSGQRCSGHNRDAVLLAPATDQTIVGAHALILSDPAAALKVDGTTGGIGIGPSADIHNGGLLTISNPGIVNGNARDSLFLESDYGLGISIFTYAGTPSDPVGYRAPQITFYRSGGTKAAQTPVLAGDGLACITAAGYDGNPAHDVPNYTQPAVMWMGATEDYDATHNGAKFTFQAIPAGSTIMQNVLVLDPSLVTLWEPLCFFSDNAHDIGADGANRPRTIYAATSVITATLIESSSHTPSSASDTGTTGQIEWDSNFVYVCVAPNTWKRTAISTW